MDNTNCLQYLGLSDGLLFHQCYFLFQCCSQINGKKVTLPRLMSNEVSVKVNDKTVMIERMSGLQVSYSLSQEIIVTVSAHMADKVCGACGRLNPSGDIPGPSLNRTMQEYMDGWNAPDFPACR